MGKRKRDKENEEYVRKKIKKKKRKLNEKLRKMSKKAANQRPPSSSSTRSVELVESLSPSPQHTTRLQSPSPPPPPPPPRRSSKGQPQPGSLPPLPAVTPPRDADHNAEIEDEDLPEEFIEALEVEGKEKVEVGDPIRAELASRWKRIMNEGLEKEAREAIIKEYPTPTNFSAAVAPIINPEILAALTEPSVKGDKRIVARQNLTGVLMSCLGRSLSNILKGNINSKQLVEEINDAAKLAAEIHFQDSSSRIFFALAGAEKTVQDAVRQSKIDKYLFGEDCGEKIETAQALKKNSNNIKSSDNRLPGPVPTAKKSKQLNWKGPPQYQQPHRARGGHQYQTPRKHYNQPHRKERQASSYKHRSRQTYRR